MKKKLILVESEASGDYLIRKLREVMDSDGVAYNYVLAEPDLVIDQSRPIQAIEKTEANTASVSFVAGGWLIHHGDTVTALRNIHRLIAHINRHKLYIANQTIFTEEYASKLWYKA